MSSSKSAKIQGFGTEKRRFQLKEGQNLQTKITDQLIGELSNLFIPWQFLEISG
jgi:hypothetical protein